MKKQLLTIGLLCMLGVTGCADRWAQEQYESVVSERDNYKVQLESITATQQNIEETSGGKQIINNTKESDSQSPKLDDIDYLSQLEITEYNYVNIIKDTVYCMVIKNNSDVTLQIDVNVTAKNTDGNLIGAGIMSEHAVQAGFEVVLERSFDGTDIADFECSITAKPDEFYSSVLSDIDMQISQADKKVIVSCTNSGDSPAQFVIATALFFKDGRLVHSNKTLCVDSDNELKPDKTINKEINTLTTYDDVKVYLSGRR